MQFSHFDLNLLRALDALLTERSVTRAAERLCLTQQALSGALQRLRQYFDDELLVRIGRQMELTPLGEALLEPVHSVLRQVHLALETRPSFEPAASRMAARIATSDYATFVLLPQLMRTLTNEAPGMTCNVERLDEASFQALENGDLDFCLAPNEWSLFGTYRPSPEIRTAELFSDDYVCVVDAAHPDVGESISLADYERLPHNCARFGRGVTTWVEQGWREAGLAVRIAATVPNFSTVMHMLPGTPLIATVQRRLANTFAPTLGLSVFECPFPFEPLSWHMVWHARSDDNPGHGYLRAALRAAALLIPG